MPIERTASNSSSSDYFDFDSFDDEFLDVLGRTVLPGDETTASASAGAGSVGKEGKEDKDKEIEVEEIEEWEPEPPLAQRPRAVTPFSPSPPLPAPASQQEEPPLEQEDILALALTPILTPSSDEASQSHSLKRKRGGDDEEGDSGFDLEDAPVDIGGVGGNVEDNELIYGASKFGGGDEYLRRKRMKLQIQNAQYRGSKKKGIFKGVSIYVNGYTIPSFQELRKMVVEYGGTFQPYLDRKSLVTHIITTSLTPAKLHEFQHMKCVRPEWITHSIAAEQLLPWQEYRYQEGDRLFPIEGTRVVQRSLFAPPTPTPATEEEGGEEEEEEEPELTPILPPEMRLVGGKPYKWYDIDDPNDPMDDLSDAPLSPPSPPPTKKPPPPPPIQPIKKPACAYAGAPSNPHAKRAMANPTWRAAHTSAAGSGFIEGFYKNSRLHHLSVWKGELQRLVKEAGERAQSSQSARGGIEDGGWDEVDVGDGGDVEMGGVSMRGARLPTSPSKDKGKGRAKDPQTSSTSGDRERIIMHCDFDCFFVAAGLVARPHYKGRPVVVCHSQGAQGGLLSTSEIASCSYEAREFGVRNGMSLQQARKLCPQIQTIPYEFEKYKKFSLQFYTVLMTHADDLQAVSVDEALIDVTSSVARLKKSQSQSESESDPFQDAPAPAAALVHPAKQLAETIRDEVRKATSCEISIGISHNILLARIATRLAKPAGSYHLLPSQVPSIIATMDISDLRGFGWATKQKAQGKLGSTSLRELYKKTKKVLCEALGKGTGETLWNAVRGIDESRLEGVRERKSVSCDITYGIRFDDNAQVKAFIMNLAEEVAKRLKSVEMLGRSITLKVMKRDPKAPVEAPKFLGHGACDTFNKQAPLSGAGGRATGDAKVIGEQAWKMLSSFGFDPKELRGVGIQIQKLESSNAASAAAGAPGASATAGSGTAASAVSAAGGVGGTGGGKAGGVGAGRGGGASALTTGWWGRGGKMAGAGRAQSRLQFKVPALPASVLAPPPAAGRASTSRSVGVGQYAKAYARPSAEASTSTAPPPEAEPASEQEPEKKLPYTDPPTFSQVDRSVFHALPYSIQKELFEDYKTRPSNEPQQPFVLKTRMELRYPKPGLYNDGTFRRPEDYGRGARERERERGGMRSVFAGGARGRGGRGGRGRGGGRGGGVTPAYEPKKKTIWAPSYYVHISSPELRSMDIDPSVFRLLHPNIQREQISLARYLKKTGKTAMEVAAEMDQRRVCIRNPRRRRRYPRKPNPRARFVGGLFLAQKAPKDEKGKGKDKKGKGKGKAKADEKGRGKEGEKVRYTETEDLLRILEMWMEGFRRYAPLEKDVNYFRRFLIRSIEGRGNLKRKVRPRRKKKIGDVVGGGGAAAAAAGGGEGGDTGGVGWDPGALSSGLDGSDDGMEKAVAVMKWWKVLLRRYWGEEEYIHDEDVSDLSDLGLGLGLDPERERREKERKIGRAWWATFRKVKGEMDAIVGRRFGGGLGLR